MKESVFLKQIRKDVRVSQKLIQIQNSSQSDSEAQYLTNKQLQVKQRQLQESLPVVLPKENTRLEHKKFQNSIQVQVNNQDLLDSSFSKSKKGQKSLQKLSPSKYSINIGIIREDEEPYINKSNSLMNPMDRKNFLMKKLRIFGETFIEPNPKDKNKQTQTNNEPLGIVGNSKFSNYTAQKQKAPQQSQYRKKRNNRNKSLIIRLDHDQKLGIGDIVKVNKIEYKKIRRESLHHMSKKQGQMKYSLLPSLN